MSVCPRCGADGWIAATPEYPVSTVYTCVTEIVGDEVHQSAQCRLNQIIRYCEKHCTPASNVGAHSLAAAVLKIAREE